MRGLTTELAPPPPGYPRSLLDDRGHLVLWLDGDVTARHPLINTAHPVAQMIKRALFTVFGIPLLVAIAMSLVDSYRRRGGGF